MGLIYQTNYTSVSNERNLKPSSMFFLFRVTHTQILKVGLLYCTAQCSNMVWKSGKHYNFDSYKNYFYGCPSGLRVWGADHVTAASLHIALTLHFLSVSTVHSPIKKSNAKKKCLNAISTNYSQRPCVSSSHSWLFFYCMFILLLWTLVGKKL